MKKEELKKLILTAGGARKADTVIKNCKVVNVFSGKIVEGSRDIKPIPVVGMETENPFPLQNNGI